jgi:outer membrane protein insertion porin family
MLEKAEQELKQQYIARGKYGVKVTTTTTPLERNRIAINFHVDEGKTAKIRGITIVGNKEFKEKELLGAFTLRTLAY